MLIQHQLSSPNVIINFWKKQSLINGDFDATDNNADAQLDAEIENRELVQSASVWGKGKKTDVDYISMRQLYNMVHSTICNIFNS